MNQRTEINSELLSADARGRKHIPFAVFAVILIHIVLFVVLLIAAGCRSTARAKANRPVEPAQGTHPAEKYMQAATNAVRAQPLVSATEQLMATEPVIVEEPRFENAVAIVEPTHVDKASKRLEQIKQSGSRPAVPEKTSGKAAIVRQGGVYVVQSGDTVQRIAKRHGTSIEAIKSVNKLKGHTIFPGQKLLLKPGPSGSTAQIKKGRSSNEV
jgi:LysM repeat protein